MPASAMRILVSESAGFSSKAAAELRRAGDLTLAKLDRSGLLAAVETADVLWIGLRHQIDAEVLRRAARLKIIVSPTTGLDHIDLAETQRREIQVLSLHGESDFLQDVRGTAEHTIALILSVLRHIPQACAHARYGDWNRDLFRGRELHGKTAGIVGYGRLGRIVARYLRTFDTRVLVTDPKSHTDQTEVGITPTSLTTLLRESDLVTLHVNLCDETRRFFGQEQFAAMKEGAWFINTSRGELVDEEALLMALRSGRLRGAALDVVSEERSPRLRDHPLVVYARENDNLIITPHIGGCTAESMAKTECFLANRLFSLLGAETNFVNASF
jgi:D-3-phosphoglycerate dehydrogenase / 2-oxoglutarate reductase